MDVAACRCVYIQKNISGFNMILFILLYCVGTWTTTVEKKGEATTVAAAAWRIIKFPRVKYIGVFSMGNLDTCGGEVRLGAEDTGRSGGRRVKGSNKNPCCDIALRCPTSPPP